MEIFLKAAGILGISPKQGVVVEDAPEGIEVAKSGGFYVVGITSSHKKDVLKKANTILSSVQEIQEEKNQFIFG